MAILPEGMLPNMSGAGNALQTFAIIMGVLIVFGGLFFLVMLKVRVWLRYKQYTCIIFEKDALGNTIETYDKAGVFFDKKSNQKLLRLKNLKVGFDPDRIGYHFTKKSKIIYFLKYGLKELRPISFSISNPDFTYKVGEVDLNWMIDDFNRNTLMFKTNSWLQQLLPFIIFGVLVFGVLILFYFLFQKFDVLQDVAVNLNAAAKQLAAVNGGTTVIQGSG
jgi:hypothetical protein